MRIGIIGQPCIDEIVHWDIPGEEGLVRHAVGGILYSYGAMERIMRETNSGDQFIPHMWLSEADRHLLDPTLNSYQHMDRNAGLWRTDAPTNRVFLFYDERGDRTANCPNVLPPLTHRELTPEVVSTLDALFINMISGHDVSIDTLESVLNEAEKLGKRPYVHVDVHALVLADLSETEEQNLLGLGGFGYRHEPRGVQEWTRWLRTVDSIQMNELEARWFGDPDVQTEDQLIAYMRHSREALRIQSLIITRAENGASLYDIHHDELHRVPIPSRNVIEPTGSGDVFGAIYTYAIANGAAPAEALRQAVDWATWNATLLTLDELLTAPR